MAFTALSNDPLALDNEWFFFARSGYTGTQQWTPMVWSGDPDASFSDAEGVPAQVRAGINNFTDKMPSYPTLSYGDIIGRAFFVGLKARY